MIISVSDFTGKYTLSKGMFEDTLIQDYIDRYEPRYLKQLFGVKLYEEFISDLQGNTPQSPNFVKIFNPFSEDVGAYYYHWSRRYDTTQTMLDSEGIKEMLKGFIYYEYAKDLVNQMTPFGNTKPQSENSTIANTLFSMMYNRYNEAIRSYQSIQDYILLNQNESVGQLLAITMVQAGTNVPTDIYDATGGSGTLAELDVHSNGMNTTTHVDIHVAGSGYKVGDQLSVDAGDNNLIVNVDSVGIGTYSYFRGEKKLTAYWL